MVAVLMAGADASADNSEAARLFDEGRTLKETGDTDGACKNFARSYELERAAGTALNLAECEERAGNWEYALELYDGAAKVFEQSDRAESAKFARERADKLRAAHAPKAEPAQPKQEQPSSKRWILGLGLGATAISAVGIVGMVISYNTMAEFQDTDVNGTWSDPTKQIVTEDDCGKGEFSDASTQSKFVASCAARDRLAWMTPVTFVSGVVGVTAIAYYLWTRPKQRSSVAIMPTGSGMAAAFEW
jgi:tetratricopeptide (TPR) repeat protein